MPEHASVFKCFIVGYQLGCIDPDVNETPLEMLRNEWNLSMSREAYLKTAHR